MLETTSPELFSTTTTFTWLVTMAYYTPATEELHLTK